MKQWFSSPFRSFNSDQNGAAFILVTVALPIIFAMAAFAVDLGYIYYVKTRLQNAADLGALAGGTLLSTGDAAAIAARAQEYADLNLPAAWRGKSTGAITATANALSDCSQNLATKFNLTCFAATGTTKTVNYVKVTVTASTPLFFSSALGYSEASLSADAVAAGLDSYMPPMNLAIVVDSTKSMEMNTTTSCEGVSRTQMECAKLAAQGMLTTLWPTVDKVALFTFPGMSQDSGSGTISNSVAAANIAKNVSGTSCSSKATVSDYYSDATPPLFKIVDFADDYRPAKTEPPPAGLNTSNSNLVLALGGLTNNKCNGLKSGSNTIYTFFVDTIDKAQAELEAANKLLTDAGKAPRQNVIVFLSDGDANVPSTYIEGSRVANACREAIKAAKRATDAKTWFFSIAYDASTDPVNSCMGDKGTSIETDVVTTKTCDSKGVCPTVTAQPVVTLVAPTAASPSTKSSTTNSSNWSSCKKSCTATSTVKTTVVTRVPNPDLASTACTTMRDMASTPDKFFSIDRPGTVGGCISSVNSGTTDLKSIFKRIALSMVKKRRIPNNSL